MFIQMQHRFKHFMDLYCFVLLHIPYSHTSICLIPNSGHKMPTLQNDRYRKNIDVESKYVPIGGICKRQETATSLPAVGTLLQVCKLASHFPQTSLVTHMQTVAG